MKKLIFLFHFLFFTFHFSFSQGLWTWMAGPTTAREPAVYGTQGMPSVKNRPPNTFTPFSWTDLQGNFWLFGGFSLPNGYSDLWKFNPNTLEWTWVKGDGSSYLNPIYGTKGVSSISNTPGARGEYGCSWVDTSGDLWLYGGLINAAFGDMWRYNIASNEWTWMAGSDTVNTLPVYGIQGIASPFNTPGSRSDNVGTWEVDDKFWMYGGNSELGTRSDMWMYDPVTNMWTWESGPTYSDALPEYGSKGIFSANNTPGARFPYNTWTDKSGHLWLLGGETYPGEESYSDMWEYDPSINQWAWVGGTQQKNSTGKAGSACLASSAFYPAARCEAPYTFKDSSGNFRMFGGIDAFYFSNLLGDMWLYLPECNEWARTSDSNVYNDLPNYGTLGVSSPTNNPGATGGGAHWQDKLGNLWIYGGYSMDTVTCAFGIPCSNLYSDMWRFVPDLTCLYSTGSEIVSAIPDTICVGTQAKLTVAGDSGLIQWQSSTDGIYFLTIPGDTLSTYKTPQGLSQTTYYRVVSKSGNCGTSTSNEVTVHILPSPSVNFSYIINDKQVSFQADSVTGDVVSYNWNFGDNMSSGDSIVSHTFDSVKTYYVCLTVYNNSNCSFTHCNYVNTLGTGVNDVSVNYSICIYPNPSNNELTIDVLNKTIPKQITISDNLGRTIIQLTTYKAITHIDVHSLTAGIYLVKIQLSDGSLKISKFVKE